MCRILIIEFLVGIYFIWSNRVFWKSWGKKLIVALAFLSILEVTFAMQLILTMPQTLEPENGALLDVVKDTLDALRSSLKATFSTLGGDSGDLMELVDQSQTQVTAGAGIVHWILGETFALVMPLLAAANIIVLAGSFHKITKIFIYGLPITIGGFGAKKVYVFSCLSPESAQLASYLAPPKGKNAAIFLRSKLDLLEDADPELHSILKNVKGILFPGGEEQLKNTSVFLWKKIEAFCFISGNADENFLLAEELLVLLNKKETNPKEIFVFSEHPSGPRLIDRLRDGLEADQHRKVHLIDPSRAMVYYLLSRYPLIIPDTGQDKVLLLGLGNFGSEFLRAALSFTVVNQNKKAKFYIYDREVRKRFSAFKLSAPGACAENRFWLAQGEAMSADLFKELQTLAKEIFCTVISLGDDEVNLQVAIHMVILLRRLHWETAADGGKEGQKQECPVRIFVHIHDHGKKMALINWCKQQKAWQPKVYVFGALEDAYSPDVLMPKRMWEQARKLHCDLKAVDMSQWGQSDPPFEVKTKQKQDMCLSEYERRSSLACVAHLTYYLLDAMNMEDEKEAFYTVSDEKNSAKDKCPEDLRKRCRVYNCAIEDFKNAGSALDRMEALARQEHLRWMNYVQSEGFCLAEDNIRRVYTEALKTHLDKDALLSPCLVPFEELKRLNAKEEIGIDFQKKDRYIVNNLRRYSKGIWCPVSDSRQ